MRNVCRVFLAIALACGLFACELGGDDPAAGGSDDTTQGDDDTGVEMANVVSFTDGHVRVTIDRVFGVFDIEIDGYRYVRAATSAVETGEAGLLAPEPQIHTAYRPSEPPRKVTENETAEGTEIRIEHPESALGRMTTVFVILKNTDGLTARLEFESKSVRDLVGLTPIYVGGTGSGLFLRSDPAQLQILQDGSEKAFDHYVELMPGDTPYSRGLLRLYLTDKPSSSSNWNAIIYDRDNGEGLNLGYLTFERVIPEIVIGYDRARAPLEGSREGYFTFQTRSGDLISANPRAGTRVSSELFWMDRFTGRPQESLEHYARMLAERHGVSLNKPPVASWDSWYIYGDKIDEALIDENLEGLVTNFLDYGQTNMQVDLGWQGPWGEWIGGDGFPNGMAQVAQKIKDAGLVPEIWMSSFNAMRRTQIMEEHPEWEAPFNPLFLFLMQLGAKPLDLSQEEVVAYQRSIGRRVADWGFGSVKFDFAYYQLGVTGMRDETHTVIEGYRKALAAFREGWGEGNLINILLNGLNVGIVDSMRIGVDTWACWGDAGPENCPDSNNTEGYDGMGLRIALKTLARRFYFNNIVWVNHPDQIFFRDFLGLVPQRSWGTVVALSGGVICLGEEISSMTQDEIDTYRRLIPNLGITGVPQDLFEREYPEVWLTPLTDREPEGYLLGLYSWGNNWDLTQNPRVEIAEGTRHHEIALAEIGIAGDFRAFEFWTQTDLGLVEDGVVRLDVPARDSRVVVLRVVEDRPYIVASNRNVSQGGTDITSPSWDPATRTLSWTQSLVSGFPHTVYIDPAGEPGAPAAQCDNGDAEVRAFGDLWAVDITPAETGSAAVAVGF